MELYISAYIIRTNGWSRTRYGYSAKKLGEIRHNGCGKLGDRRYLPPANVPGASPRGQSTNYRPYLDAEYESLQTPQDKKRKYHI